LPIVGFDISEFRRQPASNTCKPAIAIYGVTLLGWQCHFFFSTRNLHYCFYRQRCTGYSCIQQLLCSTSEAAGDREWGSMSAFIERKKTRKQDEEVSQISQPRYLQALLS